MKFWLHFAMIVLLQNINIAAKATDSYSGVYLTKEDFDKNLLSFATPYRLKEKFGFLNSDFEYEAKGILVVRETKKKFLYFEPGTIFGFCNQGRKYIFLPEVKKYLFVLNETPVMILIREYITYFRFFTHTDLKLFYRNGSGNLKIMSKKNISEDFYDHDSQLKALINIEQLFADADKTGEVNIAKIREYIKQQFITQQVPKTIQNAGRLKQLPSLYKDRRQAILSAR